MIKRMANKFTSMPSTRQNKLRAWMGMMLLLGLPACAAVTPAAQSQQEIHPTHTATFAPSNTPTPQPTETPAPTLLPTETLAPQLSVCSPLQSFTLEELPNILSNPYNPPRTGDDRPHHGVDFSYYRYGDRIGMLGLPIYAVLEGTVVMVNNDRFPYGHTLLIETPLDTLPPGWLDVIPVPTPAPTLEFNSPLTCPIYDPDPAWNTERRSLYLLYAHMNQAPQFASGEQVECGQQIGEVGNSGNSINEHLHLEVRVGPAGIRFDSMGHYDIRITDQERYNYCVWRISELFQKIDPGKLLFSGLN
jgi:murein DD-endopeptidase MepM/ murein hydrolase activator NlpD